MRKGRTAGRDAKRKLIAFGLAAAFMTIALAGVQTVLAEGDKNRITHGEDEGYYDANNSNPYDDDFPGEDVQNRTGVV